MSIFTYIKSHTVVAGAITFVIIVGAVITGRAITKKSTSEVSESNNKLVTLVPASSFRNDTSTVSADGIVESLSQVDLKSQIGAPLSAVYVSVGDSVTTGQKIAEFQNADIRAQLDQAKASLALAQGQHYTGGVSLESARKSALDKIQDAYTRSDDAVHAQVDQFLSNNIGGAPQFYQYNTDVELNRTLPSLRVDLESMFTSWKTTIASLTTSSTDEEINAAIAESHQNLDQVTSFLDIISQALNTAARSATGQGVALISGWKTAVTNARTSVNTGASNLTAAETSWENSKAVYGSSAEAQVSVAEAGVKNLEAQLSKTIITSPISGKVAVLPLRTGEFSPMGQLITTIVGSGGLDIKAYASQEDFSKIQKGAHATIDGNIPGTVASVAPSLNQANKKVEIKILVNDSDSSKLVIGENVQATIASAIPASLSASAAASSTKYILPMQDVKIVPGNAFIFTVDGDSKIVEHPVTLGNIQGDFVEVMSGITDGMNIVSPVYELNEGQTVRVQ